MEVKEGAQMMRFYKRIGEKGKHSELLLVESGKGNSLISIKGEIDPQEIGQITSDIHFTGDEDDEK